jgi:hypothetical protein
MRIEIASREDEDGVYHDVIGRDGTLRADGSEESFCIALVDWEDWLGMEIDPGIRINYSELDIVCHCLWEMTWFGDSPAMIEKFKEDLNNQRLEDTENIVLDDDWRKIFEGN